MNTTTATSVPPNYLHNLQDRAASVLRAQWPASTQVTFTARDTDGCVLNCRARFDLDDLTLRVFELHTGERLCQSEPGAIHVLDMTPSTWHVIEWDAPL